MATEDFYERCEDVCMQTFEDSEILVYFINTFSEGELREMYERYISGMEDTHPDFRVTIINSKMIKFDLDGIEALRDFSHLLESGRKSEEIELPFRPYFQEFIFNIDSIANSDSRNLFSMMTSGLWYRASLNSSYSEKTDLSIKGEVLTAVRTIDMQQRTLVIKKSNMCGFPLPVTKDGKISSMYNFEEVPFIEDVIDSHRISSAFDTIPLEEIEVYSLGHGNSIRIGSAHYADYSFLYDVGFSYKKGKVFFEKNYPYYVQEISNLCPKAVILSHWDFDHIAGCIYLPDEAFLSPWIAPGLRKDSTNASRVLAAVLNACKSLYLFEPVMNDRKGVPIVLNMADAQLMIWKGASNNLNPKIEPSNQEGIALTLSKGDQYAMMYGDVPYSSLPVFAGRFLERSSLLVVPHHGRSMNLEPLDRISSSRFADMDKKAIVCSSDFVFSPFYETTEEVDLNHLRALKSAGYKLLSTGSKEKSIRILYSRVKSSSDHKISLVNVCGWDGLLDHFLTIGCVPYYSFVFDCLHGDFSKLHLVVQRIIEDRGKVVNLSTLSNVYILLCAAYSQMCNDFDGMESNLASIDYNDVCDFSNAYFEALFKGVPMEDILNGIIDNDEYFDSVYNDMIALFA